MSRILHIEDEDVWRDFVKRTLADHHVDSAASYDDALMYLQGSAPYDLALVDLALSKKPGDLLGGQILDLLLARYPHTRRVVVTGSPPQGSIRRTIFERYEVEEIIIKGQQDLPDLRRIVESALDQKTSDVSQDVKFRKSELRARLRDWQRSQTSIMNEKVRGAEEYVRNAERLDAQSGRRAQRDLGAAQAQRDTFKSDCSAIEERINGVVTMNDSFQVLEELERLEARYTESVPN